MQWLINLIIKSFFATLIEKISGFVADFIEKRRLAKEQKKKTEDFTKVVEDPSKTREERKSAEDAFLNR